MIYAIRAVGTEFVKIGFTSHYVSMRRLKQLQTGCPYDLEVIAFADGNQVDESYLHAMLLNAGLHVRGEWFKWGETTERVVNMLKAMPKPQPPFLARKARNPHRRLGAALSVEYRKSAGDGSERLTSFAGVAKALQSNKGPS